MCVRYLTYCKFDECVNMKLGIDAILRSFACPWQKFYWKDFWNTYSQNIRKGLGFVKGSIFMKNRTFNNAVAR